MRSSLGKWTSLGRKEFGFGGAGAREEEEEAVRAD